MMCLPNGRWAQEAPICTLKPDFCPPIDVRPGVILKYSNRDKEQRVVFRTLVKADCSPLLPFKGRPLLVGSRYRICKNNGKWSGTDPFCIDSDKYQLTDKGLGISTKSLAIICVVVVSTVLVVIFVILVICCHITQKCYQCCSQCFSGSSNEEPRLREDPIRAQRPESKVDISEINATIDQLANFQPKLSENIPEISITNNIDDIVEVDEPVEPVKPVEVENKNFTEC